MMDYVNMEEENEMEMVSFVNKSNNNTNATNNKQENTSDEATASKETKTTYKRRKNKSSSQSQSSSPTTTSVSGWTQLKALLHKNYIIQVSRNTTSTVIDIVLVPILILFLVIIYKQTSIITFMEHSYSNVNITFPSDVFMENFVPFYDSDIDIDVNSHNSNGTNGTSGDSGRRLGNINDVVRRLIINDAYDMKYQQQQQELLKKETTTINRKLEEQQGMSFSGSSVPSEIPFKKNPHKKNDVMMQLYLLHQSLQNILNGPLSIPTIDQYIYMSDIVNSIVKPDDMNAMLQNSDFFRIWGNMITLGTIHLSPRNHYLMDELLVFWREEHRITRNLIKIRVHENSNDAMKYVYDHLDERTWALIDIHNTSNTTTTTTSSSSSVDDNKSQLDDVEFIIRMNYTTIPNTAQLSNEISVGLNTDYQQYYLSGFLTIQQTLDDFIMYYSSKIDGCANCSASNDGAPKRRVSMPLPTPSYAQNPFYAIAGMFFSSHTTLTFLRPSSKFQLTITTTITCLNLCKWTIF